MVKNISITEDIINNLKLSALNNQRPCFIFVRISDMIQKDGVSLDYQEQEAINYCKRMNLFPVYTFKTIETAFKPKDRKTFNSMLDLAQNFNIKEIIFKNTDRMDRNTESLTKIRDLIEEMGLKIHFYEQNRIFDKVTSNYDSDFTLEMEICWAKKQSAKISHDLKNVYRFKTEKGIAPGRSPIGYKYNTREKKHYIDSEKFEMMSFIFNEFDNNRYSLQEFTKIVNENGYRTNYSKPWSKSEIWRVLSNPFYHGEFYHHENIFPGNHEPYYNKDRWIERKKRFDSRFYPRKTKRNYHFAKLIKCTCGIALTGDIKKGKYIYYIHKCRNKSDSQISILEETLESKIDKEIEKLEFSEDFSKKIKDLFNQMLDYKTKDNASKIEDINKKIAQLKLKSRKYLDLFGESSISKEDLIEVMNQCKEEIKILESKKNVSETINHKLIIQIADVIDTIRRFKPIYLESTVENKSKLLRQVTSKMTLDSGKIKIDFLKPFSILLKPEIDKIKNCKEVRIRLEMLPEQDSNLRPND